jgi:HEAT repeat protein
MRSDLGSPSFRARIAAIRDWLGSDYHERDAASRRWDAEFERLVAEVAGVRDIIAIARDKTRSNIQRAVAAWLLGRLEARTAEKTLLSLLCEKIPMVSFKASEALCTVGTSAAVPRLVRIIASSPFSESRAGACWVLHKVVNTTAAPALRIAAIEDRAAAVREAAVHGLISYPSRATYSTLAKALHDESPRVRSVAVFAVSCLSEKAGMEVAIPALTKLIRGTPATADSGPIVRRARDAVSTIRSHLAKMKNRERRKGTA